MSEQVDVEIFVIPRDVSGAAYEVQLRVARPDDQAVDSPARVETRFDPAQFIELEEQPHLYGRALYDALFPAGAVRAAFERARESAAEQDWGIRVRLVLDALAPRLHDFIWETLRDDRGRWALTDERFFFSRFLSADEGRAIKLTPKGTLSAMIAVASPTNLSDKFPELAAVDVAGEVARATRALGSIPVVVTLPQPEGGGRSTLDRIITGLERSPDILYLVCHGAVREQRAHVLLEKEDGTIDIVLGDDIAARIRDLARPPRLVVLASCQSAGEGRTLSTNDGGALAALGPLLARAGVPAVLAMQGNIEMGTMERFMPRFFVELARTKCPDRAVASARSLVREAVDAHQPVLFSRLRDGRLWYEPGFGRAGFDSWGDLVNALATGDCLPIIGPGLLDPLLGDSGEMATRWAEAIGFPRIGRHRLTEVAQFMAAAETLQYLLEFSCGDWRQQLLRLGARAIGEVDAERFRAMPDPMTPAQLSEIISAVGAGRRAQSDDDPYRVLARMKVPIYVTATPDNLLEDALEEAGRPPVVEVLCWNEREQPWPSRLEDSRAGYTPSFKKPLVYHLFGHFSQPSALVMTEDDHFDYLMHVGSGKMPATIRSAMVGRPLLFLGFQVDDWRFRVLYRSIVNEERMRRTPGLKRRSVSVQLEPNQDVAEPRRLRRTLERYFEGARVHTYWGTAYDFAAELWARWKARGHAA